MDSRYRQPEDYTYSSNLAPEQNLFFSTNSSSFVSISLNIHTFGTNLLQDNIQTSLIYRENVFRPTGDQMALDGFEETGPIFDPQDGIDTEVRYSFVDVGGFLAFVYSESTNPEQFQALFTRRFQQMKPQVRGGVEGSYDVMGLAASGSSYAFYKSVTTIDHGGVPVVTAVRMGPPGNLQGRGLPIFNGIIQAMIDQTGALRQQYDVDIHDQHELDLILGPVRSSAIPYAPGGHFELQRMHSSGSRHSAGSPHAAGSNRTTGSYRITGSHRSTGSHGSTDSASHPRYCPCGFCIQ
ncbi:hypothetical protein BO70DRAFT_352082 [Aspergillus heteromorphus CBS 117.55]|uniref:Uncharacterized protein n=1 Tax=Aspergillus heteromorphus CBS 117.55 TaxID=1448321 RepID=A0A317WIT3_9EURO|nr:uncharacterized protein BO70DRAFT_352082 [Aspergillus heteromorphus CBS 117.55]PWY84968.1 hypothetical protein BO70DRAFT_352082 [Aspergillus heteromorphus CBS 117.55]